MRKCSRILGGVLSLAMLVGMLPTSAFAAHTELPNQNSIGDAQLYINAEGENDPVLSIDDELKDKYSRIPDDTYPYLIPLTQEQYEENEDIVVHANATVTMGHVTAGQLLGQKTLDVKNTKFMILMATGQDMSIQSDALVFNSTFLQPDEDALPEGVTVTRMTGDEIPEDAYQSNTNTAVDMYWKITGDLDQLLWIDEYVNPTNPMRGGDTISTVLQDTSRDFYFDYLDDLLVAKEQADDTYITEPYGTYWRTGGIHHDSIENATYNDLLMGKSTAKLYTIPVKMNYEELAKEELDRGDYVYATRDEETWKAGQLYTKFTLEDWMAPMELTAIPDDSGQTGIAFQVSTADIDQYIPTASESNWYMTQYGTNEYNIRFLPLAGCIWGELFQYNKLGDDTGYTSRQRVTGSANGYRPTTIEAGTILVQFTKPVTGDIKVEKTIQVQDGVTLTDDQIAALAALNDTKLGITVTNADGNEVAEGNTLTLSWDADSQTLTASGKISGLASDTTYDVSVDAESTAALEAAGLYLQGGIQVSGGEDIDLTDYYQLTRNEDDTVNTSGLIDEGKVPTVTVTSTYGTEKPVAPTVTLTYEANGGDGPDKEFTQDLVDGKAEFTVIENPFTRDEVNGVTYSFTGWNTRADGNGEDYAPGEQITLTADETLYAQWQVNGEEPVEPPSTAISKTLSGNLDQNGETDVTLSIPSAGYEQTVDVVLAVDCSNFALLNAEKLQTSLATLADKLLQQDINLNVGVVGFGMDAAVFRDITAVNTDNTATWASDLVSEISKNIALFADQAATNIQAGVRSAHELLDNSTSGADKNHQYMVLMTDGAGYWYCDDADIDGDGNTSEGVNKLYRSVEFTGVLGNMDGNGEVGEADRETHVGQSGDFAAFMKQYGNAVENSAENSYTADQLENPTNDMVGLIYDEVNDEDYFLNMERGTYRAAREIEKVIADGYKVITIGDEYKMIDSTATPVCLKTISDSFRAWTGSENVGRYYDFYEVENAFNDLSDQITYFVDAGSYVIDQMGSGTDDDWSYDFDFVNDAQYLTLTVGGETRTVTSLGENSYGFGEPNGSTYPFVLTYTPEEDGKDDSFRLDINVPVLASEPVQLTYRVKQVNEEDSNTHGQYDPDGSQNSTGLFTNSNATLYPKDGPAMEFPKPTVSVGAIRIWPADITIYTGGDGYESVVTGSGNSQVGTASDGLPEPGFYVELPAALNRQLIEQADPTDVTTVTNEDGETVQVVDLSDYLSFTYDDDQGNTRLWKLERYDKQTGNDSMAYSRYIYRILPAVVGDETIPIRLQFEAPDGTLTTSDDFTIHLDGLFQKYGMSIYPGALNQDMVKAQITLNETKTDYDTVVDKGKLTVRGVTDQDTITTEVVKGDAPADEVEDITAHVPGDTQFYINESQLEVVDPSKVELLVDSIVPDEDNTLQNSAINRFDEITSSQQVQLNYLDLVDTSNGNAWVTASEPITVYWPYPEGTDQNDTFYIVHYEDLDRNDNNALEAGDYTMELYSAAQGNLENTPQGIKITVESFSPFALFWGESGDPDWPPVDPNPDPDPDPTPDPDPEDPDKPELNTEDHYAYIVGYPDGNVKPEGNITRAEVATIFFRLLTDESRDEFWSQTNPYSDVSEDDWYNNAVSTLTNAGIIDGYEDGTFKPNGNITRAEFATIAVRFFEATYEGENLFPDIDGHWAQDYINEAANAGIVDGYPDGTFGPQKLITRAEAMTMVNRTIDRHPHEDHLLDDMIVWPDNPETAWYYEQVQEATNSHEYTMNTDDEQNPYEIWTELLPVRDWAQLEKEWSDAHSGQSGGDVV